MENLKKFKELINEEYYSHSDPDDMDGSWLEPITLDSIKDYIKLSLTEDYEIEYTGGESEIDVLAKKILYSLNNSLDNLRATHDYDMRKLISSIIKK